MDKTEMQPESHAACSGENGNVVNGTQPNEAGVNPSSDHLVSGNIDSSPDVDVLVKALVEVYGPEYSEAEIQRSIQLYEMRRKTRYSRGHSAEIVEIMDEFFIEYRTSVNIGKALCMSTVAYFLMQIRDNESKPSSD